MIYIPFETKLQWILEDIQEIKQQFAINIQKSFLFYGEKGEYCPDCEFVKEIGLGDTKCKYHSPEFNIRLDFPIE